MSQISREKSFDALVELTQHLNDTLHKWLSVYLAVQSGLALAVSYLLSVDTGANWLIPIIIGCLCIFAIAVSRLISSAIQRNRFWLKWYIQRAVEVEGGDGFIWKSKPPDIKWKTVAKNVAKINAWVVGLWGFFLGCFVLSRLWYLFPSSKFFRWFST